MNRVALYARVSSEQQAEKDLSIPSQLKAMREHCLRQGWEIVREFVDEAQSARTANRPEFIAMISAAKRKPKSFDMIVVWKFSRFARNREDSIVFKSLLRKHGVQVHSLNEKIDDSPTGKLMEAIIESMDEFYSANVAQETKRGMKEASARGFFCGGHVPLGYRVIKVKDGEALRSKLDIDPVTAPLAQTIFRMFLNGHGGVKISEYLNSKGMFGRKGKPWGNTSVYHVLKNPVYLGDTVFDRTNKMEGACPIVTKDTHPALITREHFEFIQSNLSDRKPTLYNPKSFASPYLFSGLTRCGHCGAVMTATSGKSGRFRYYTCTNRMKKGRSACSSKAVPKERFESAIIECLKANVLTERNLADVVRLFNVDVLEHQKAQSKERLGLEGELESLGKRRAKLYEALETDQVQIKDLAPRLKDLTGQIDALKAKLASLEATPAPVPTPSPDQIKARVKDLQNLLELSSLATSKAFLRSFIKSVTVALPKVEIEYTLPLISKEAEPLEVLLLLRNGSPGWIRTSNPPINSRMLHH